MVFTCWCSNFSDRVNGWTTTNRISPLLQLHVSNIVTTRKPLLEVTSTTLLLIYSFQLRSVSQPLKRNCFSQFHFHLKNQKVKPITILMKQEVIGWQWQLLDHMQINCTSLQTDNHASISSLKFLQARCSFWRPTNSVKALKATSKWILIAWTEMQSGRMMAVDA